MTSRPSWDTVVLMVFFQHWFLLAAWILLYPASAIYRHNLVQGVISVRTSKTNDIGCECLGQPITTGLTKTHSTLVRGCDPPWSYLVFSYTSFTDRTDFANVLNLHPPAPTFMRLQKLFPMGYLAQA